MAKRSWQQLRAYNRPQAWIDAVLSCPDVRQTDDGIEYPIASDCIKAANDGHYARLEAMLPQPGLGDWLEGIIARFPRFKKAAEDFMRRVTGKKDCGCGERKKALNDLGKKVGQVLTITKEKCP